MLMRKNYHKDYMPRGFLRHRRLVSHTYRFVGGTRMAHVRVGFIRGHGDKFERCLLYPPKRTSIRSVGPPTRGQGVGQSLCVEGSAVLDAVQDASRRLRRCQMASWTASVRDALPIGRSGRRNGLERSNKGMKFTGSRLSARSGSLGHTSCGA